MKVVTLLLMLLTGCPGLFAQTVRFAEAENLKDYEKILELSREQEKMLFVALHDGGGQFKAMFDEGVFNSTALNNALSAYTAVAIDVRDEMGSRWIDLFPAVNLPAFYFLNDEEFLLHKAEGYQSTDSLVRMALRAEKMRHRYDTLLKSYNANALTTAQWKELIELHGLNFSFAQTSALAWEMLNAKSEAELLHEDLIPVLVEYGVDLETKYPAYIIKNQKAIASKLSDFDFGEYFERAYSYNLDLAILNNDSTLVNEIHSVLIPHDPDPEAKAGELTLATYRMFAEETENYSMWVEGAKKAADAMNDQQAIAKMYFDEGFDLADSYNSQGAVKAANALARLSVQKQLAYRPLMLESYTFYLLNNYTKALEQVKKAFQQASSSAEAQQASNLMKMIEREMN